MKYIQKDILIRAINYYFNFGFEVFPVDIFLDRKGYKDLRPGKWKNVTYTRTNSLRLANKKPYNGLCLKAGVYSDVFVLDLDVKDNINGMANLGKMGITYPVDTPREKTPSGGLHLYFKYPKNISKHNSCQRKVGIDWRGENGLIILAPTILPDGKEYKWLTKIAKDKSNLRYPPEKLLKWILSNADKAEIHKREHGRKTISDLTESQLRAFFDAVQRSATAPKGKRSTADIRAMNFAVKIGLSRDTIKQYLYDVGKFKERGEDYFNLTYKSAINYRGNRL